MPRHASRAARPALVAASSLALLVACPDDRVKEPTRLADADSWVRVTDPAEDVFADMRPADAPCDEAGYYVDPLSMSFEVQTSLCDYLTVAQAISAPVYAGDRIAIAASHDTLVAPAPSQGYMGLALDGEIIWELDVPIPASAEVYMDELVLDRDIPAGAVLQLHVHNHGENTWELQSVRCLPPEDA